MVLGECPGRAEGAWRSPARPRPAAASPSLALHSPFSGLLARTQDGSGRAQRQDWAFCPHPRWRPARYSSSGERRRLAPPHRLSLAPPPPLHPSYWRRGGPAALRLAAERSLPFFPPLWTAPSPPVFFFLRGAAGEARGAHSPAVSARQRRRCGGPWHSRAAAERRGSVRPARARDPPGGRYEAPTVPGRPAGGGAAVPTGACSSPWPGLPRPPARFNGRPRRSGLGAVWGAARGSVRGLETSSRIGAVGKGGCGSLKEVAAGRLLATMAAPPLRESWP